MRKIISQMMISLDGYVEGTGQQLDWHVVDDEYHEYAAEQLHSADTILYGRATYEHMKNFWSTPFAMERFPAIAERMNALPKIVISSTLEHADWHETEIVQDRIADKLTELKRRSGRNLLVLGSSQLVTSLTQLALIDEYHVIVNPVVLGSGKAFMHNIQNRAVLHLTDTRVFRSGNVLLCYRRAD